MLQFPRKQFMLCLQSNKRLENILIDVLKRLMNQLNILALFIFRQNAVRDFRLFDFPLQIIENGILQKFRDTMHFALTIRHDPQREIGNIVIVALLFALGTVQRGASPFAVTIARPRHNAQLRIVNEQLIQFTRILRVRHHKVFLKAVFPRRFRPHESRGQRKLDVLPFFLQVDHTRALTELCIQHMTAVTRAKEIDWNGNNVRFPIVRLQELVHFLEYIRVHFII